MTMKLPSIRLVLALLAAVLMTAPAAAQNSCPGDVNGDRVVAGEDLASVLGGWGL